jgi:uncharacterized protein YlxW (UPF0749 family)
MAHQNPATIAPQQLLASGITPEAKVASTQLDLQHEVDRLTQEVQRLNQVIAEQREELDAYRKASQAWAVAQVSEADIRLYAQEEPGLPLEAFIDELELPHQGH